MRPETTSAGSCSSQTGLARSGTPRADFLTRLFASTVRLRSAEPRGRGLREAVQRNVEGEKDSSSTYSRARRGSGAKGAGVAFPPLVSTAPVSEDCGESPGKEALWISSN